jgi:hypothetical protein
MRAVYEAFGRGRPGYPVRDDAYWAHWERFAVRRSGAWLRLAINGRGRVGAYLLAGLWDGQDVGILEWPYAPDAAEAVSLLLAALVADPIAHGKRKINGALPWDHIAYASGGSLRGTLSVVDHMMVRAYTSCGAQVEELLRGETEGRSIYWAADYF